jgi:ABC-2 type transport system permease protein
MSRQNVLSISDETKKFITELQLADDLYIYWIVQAGHEDAAIGSFLARYAEMNERIVIARVDPVTHPDFVSRYSGTLRYNNSLIIVYGSRNRPVPYTDIYMDDPETGTFQTVFSGENAVTGAIDYVTSSDIPKVYRLTGHGEQVLSDTVSDAVRRSGYGLGRPLPAAQREGARGHRLFADRRSVADIADEEKNHDRGISERRRQDAVITGYTSGSLPHLEALMAGYGVSRSEGIVMDAALYISTYPLYLLPTVISHDITAPLRNSGYYIVFPLSQGLTVSKELPDGVLVSPLLTTSENSYSKVAGTGMSTMNYESGDISGPFDLGVAILSGDTRIVWYTCNSLVSDVALSWSSGANQDLFLNTLHWMCRREQRISIHSKLLDAVESVPFRRRRPACSPRLSSSLSRRRRRRRRGHTDKEKAKMKKRDKLLIFILVLALLVVVCWALPGDSAGREAAQEKDADEEYFDLVNTDSERLTEMVWTYEGVTTYLDLWGDTWVCPDLPEHIPYCEYVVAMRDAVCRIKCYQIIPDVTDFSVYGFDEPRMTVETGCTDGSRHIYELGSLNEITQHFYMRMDGGGDVYLIDEELLYAFAYDIYDII